MSWLLAGIHYSQVLWADCKYRLIGVVVRSLKAFRETELRQAASAECVVRVRRPEE